MYKKATKGFTLIELLVVIAIIGILSSVVLASLNTARLKSRDTRRVADIKQIQLALQLYFDAVGEYPDALGDLDPTYIAVVPNDPTGGAYLYDNLGSATADTACAVATGSCTYYHLSANLEESTNSALTGDRDLDYTTINGDDADGCTLPTPETNRYCYDVTP